MRPPDQNIQGSTVARVGGVLSAALGLFILTGWTQAEAQSRPRRLFASQQTAFEMWGKNQHKAGVYGMRLEMFFIRLS